ncbi:hypothetical protein ACFLQW_01305 [Candidatus Zixiibacteriota bacterium]
MTYGIGSILLALLLVIMLSLASHGQSGRQRTKLSGFRHVAAQVDTLQSMAKEEMAFKVLVFHPASRTSFGDLEKSVNAISESGKIPTKMEYHAWGEPSTTMLARSMKIQTSSQSTLVVFKAPNGATTWGGLEERIATATPQVTFPTPRMCEIIKSAQSGRDVLLVFNHDDAPNGEQLVLAATAYVQMPVNKAELYIIDPNDPANQEIVTRTKLPPDSLKDARLLFMTAGQVRGQLTGAITNQDLQGLKKSCSGKAGCC